MPELFTTPRFVRAYRSLAGKNPALQLQIDQTLRRMAADANDPRLKTHHLSGELAGFLACSAGYDLRIVFSKQKNEKTGAEVLVLTNIGTHDEVY